MTGYGRYGYGYGVMATVLWLWLLYYDYGYVVMTGYGDMVMADMATVMADMAMVMVFCYLADAVLRLELQIVS